MMVLLENIDDIGEYWSVLILLIMYLYYKYDRQWQAHLCQQTPI